jgi:hypothetical protein
MEPRADGGRTLGQGHSLGCGQVDGVPMIAPMPTNGAYEELDLMIHNMHSSAQETEVQKILGGIVGVHSARIVQGGVWLRYNAHSITKEQISAALHQAGYRAGVFQDSKSGHLGKSSQ